MNFRPLTKEEIEVRVNRVTDYGVDLLLYKDARCDMNVLDEAVGSMNWQRSHSRENANCTVSIWDAEKSMWISKEDTGTESNIEAEKGLASDSFKRACTNWGIGRELYSAPRISIPLKYVETKRSNNKLQCVDTFFVDKIETETDEKGVKRIITLTIGIRHKNQSDWIYSWSLAADKFKINQPTWLTPQGQPNYNQQGNNGNNGYPQGNGYPQNNAPVQNNGYPQGNYQQNGGYQQQPNNGYQQNYNQPAPQNIPTTNWEQFSQNNAPVSNNQPAPNNRQFGDDGMNYEDF